MNRVTVALQPNEKDALLRFAQEERRNPRAQAAIIIRRELERLGYLHSQPQQPQVRILEAAYEHR